MLKFVPDTGVPGFRVGLSQGGAPAGNAGTPNVDAYFFGDPRDVGTIPESLFQLSSLPARPTSLESMPRPDPGPDVAPSWLKRSRPFPWLYPLEDPEPIRQVPPLSPPTSFVPDIGVNGIRVGLSQGGTPASVRNATTPAFDNDSPVDPRSEPDPGQRVPPYIENPWLYGRPKGPDPEPLPHRLFPFPPPRGWFPKEWEMDRWPVSPGPKSAPVCPPRRPKPPREPSPTS